MLKLGGILFILCSAIASFNGLQGTATLFLIVGTFYLLSDRLDEIERKIK
jgi:hypothetical protein